MRNDPTITALAQCGLQCLQARDGRGRRWAIERCTRALRDHGTPPALAERSARAMEAVALGIRRSAAQLAP